MPRDHKQPTGFFQRLFGRVDVPAPHTLAAHDSVVIPDPVRCVQCGVCGWNCPVGIPVRDYACRGRIVDHPDCVQCGQCIEACPRGTLRWGRRPEAPADGRREADYAETMRLLSGASFGQRR